ncbi:MAG: ABC transporter permease [Bryobacteraceae bacterium]|nr:ABC transporter permease [Solibacteraceae bacterium]MCL4844822.1 ABC transporter permease [Bryobacteraceae bacterium]MCO5351846.1 ABC transporter permease [Bryobacteraceae bacterium]HAX42500.1 multidrug ABC transporter substrate-binding protein [Bryobacterales bacterium]HRJ18602.1 ABC transporter permease [Bryobacteraceae bacterium]
MSSRTRFVLTDFAEAFANLRAQKTRTLLTALGIVFGVGSVIGMLSIGAGAREESLRFIERLGVRNVLVDSIPASSREELQQRRRTSPGLSERDVRILEANVEGLESLSPRRTLHPARVLPKPSGSTPALLGVRPSFAAIHNLRTLEGRLFDSKDDEGSLAVCVLGQAAKINLLGYGPAVGRHVKVNDTWLQVIGVLAEQVTTESGRNQDRNNAIFIPFNTFAYRFWDSSRFLKDDLDGVDLRLRAGVDSVQAAKVVTAILGSTHRNAEDFTVTIPAALLEQQKRTQTIFTYVMVAIAAISLLVGGIGIMNIVLATVMERTREIGIRRAMGARKRDILRQFLTESVVISVGGGLLGIACGVVLSRLIAYVAEWSTIVTPLSVIVAFGVSVAVGVMFGIYPAMKAAEIDPIEALRYE